jgi:hypothetical protein
MMCNDRCVQDVVVVLAPFPNNPNPVDEFAVVRDFDLKGDGLVWYTRPQLFFNVALCRWDCQDRLYHELSKVVQTRISFTAIIS